MSESETPAPKMIETRDVVGQDHAIDSFLAAVQGQRLAHGWIFNGRHGVGKMSFAMLIARAVLTNGPPQDRVALTSGFDSAEGRLVSQGVHPDLRVITRDLESGQKQIDVDQVRQLKNFFAHSAARSHWRVAIIDAVDDMNRNASNALLKILEEPPSNCLLILINHNQGRLLDTLRSRCRMVHFNELSSETMMQILPNLCPGRDQRALSAAAFLAEGSLAEAVFLVEHGGFEHYKAMLDAVIAVGSGDYDTLHSFSDYVASRDDVTRFDAFIGLVGAWLIRISKYASGAASYSPLYTGEQDFVDRLVTSCSVSNLFETWEKIQHIGRETSALNLDKKQAVMSSLMLINSLIAADPSHA
jgi:DNA polymerase-3 subunit delta'